MDIIAGKKFFEIFTGFWFFIDFNVPNAEHRYMTHHKYMKEISVY